MAASDSDRPDGRTYLQIYDYETEQFSGLTTYHGLVRIYNSNTWPSRIFWCVVVLSCLSLFMIHSGYLLIGYHSKPTLFQVNTVVPPEGILLPDITICPSQIIQPHKLQGWNMSREVVNYMTQYFSDIPQDNMGYLERLHRKFLNYKINYESIKGESFNEIQFFKNVRDNFGPSCSEVVLSCSFAGDRVPCCENAESIITDVGPCILIKSSGYRQWFSGSRYGWTFHILSSARSIDASIGAYNEELGEKGIKVVVSEPKKRLSVRSHMVAAPSMYNLHLGVEVKNISYLQRGDWGVCRSDWNTIPAIDTILNLTYTSGHCEWNWEGRGWLAACDCLPLSFAIYNTSHAVCSPLQIAQCSNKINLSETLDCDTECHTLSYEIFPSYSDLDTVLPGVKDVVKDDPRVSVLQVYTRGVAYERHEQQKQLQTADLLSNIAGSMGLFLGMSTVTLLEIFIYLFKSVWGTVNTERQEQFKEARLAEEEEKRQSVIILDPGMEEDEEMGLLDVGGDRKTSIATPLHINIDRRPSRFHRNSIMDHHLLPRLSVANHTMGHRQSIAGVMGRRGSQWDSEIHPQGRRPSQNPHRPSLRPTFDTEILPAGRRPSQTYRRREILASHDEKCLTTFLDPATELGNFRPSLRPTFETEFLPAGRRPSQTTHRLDLPGPNGRRPSGIVIIQKRRKSSIFMPNRDLL